MDIPGGAAKDISVGSYCVWVDTNYAACGWTYRVGAQVGKIFCFLLCVACSMAVHKHKQQISKLP